jgi:hypothetical protein
VARVAGAQEGTTDKWRKVGIGGYFEQGFVRKKEFSTSYMA